MGFSGPTPIPTSPFCLLPPSACFLLYIFEYMALGMARLSFGL